MRSGALSGRHHYPGLSRAILETKVFSKRTLKPNLSMADRLEELTEKVPYYSKVLGVEQAQELEGSLIPQIVRSSGEVRELLTLNLPVTMDMAR